jgi:hypothetical protein
MSAAAVPILSTDWLTWMITRQERIADGNLHNNFFGCLRHMVCNESAKSRQGVRRGQYWLMHGV